MHVHILGVCGTFMGGLALLAKELGFRVTGADQNVYPPMSTQLSDAGVELIQGYADVDLLESADVVVVGNVMTRGHAVIEYMLERNMSLMSGPQWLAEYVLKDRWVLAVAGTHGKTTTSSMLAWILQASGLNPGFLIGGVPKNFGLSARLGESPFFVVEADEYDTAFFDKRSKFIHYRPRTLVINNIEFDHADIFRDLTAIQQQFNHLLKLIPEQGKIIYREDDTHIAEVLEMGVWSATESFASNPHADTTIEQFHNTEQPLQMMVDQEKVECLVPLYGDHNGLNAVAAILAARHAGIAPKVAAENLESFEGVKRRLEHKGTFNEITIYDDFAHHPTEIECTISAFAKRFPEQRLVVVFEPRSNSMRMGTHTEALKNAFEHANELHVYEADGLGWSFADVLGSDQCIVYSDISRLAESLCSSLRPNDNVLILSNGGFGGLCDLLLECLSKR